LYKRTLGFFVKSTIKIVLAKAGPHRWAIFWVFTSLSIKAGTIAYPKCSYASNVRLPPVLARPAISIVCNRRVASKNRAHLLFLGTLYSHTLVTSSRRIGWSSPFNSVGCLASG
jgi:hypothetical protein